MLIIFNTSFNPSTHQPINLSTYQPINHSTHHIFNTERLLVRPYTMDDFNDFFRLNGDEEIMRYIRPAQSREQSMDYLAAIIKAYDELPGIGRWAMLSKSDNKFVGSFAIIPVKNSTDIQLGYALLKENWGKGYASESVNGGLDYAFDFLKLKSIAGITEHENVASQKVLLKSGFIFEKFFEEEGKKLHFYRYTPSE